MTKKGTGECDSATCDVRWRGRNLERNTWHGTKVPGTDQVTRGRIDSVGLGESTVNHLG